MDRGLIKSELSLPNLTYYHFKCRACTVSTYLSPAEREILTKPPKFPFFVLDQMLKLRNISKFNFPSLVITFNSKNKMMTVEETFK